MIERDEYTETTRLISFTTQEEHEIKEMFRLAAEEAMNDEDGIIYGRELWFGSDLGNDGRDEYSLAISVGGKEYS